MMPLTVNHPEVVVFAEISVVLAFEVLWVVCAVAPAAPAAVLSAVEVQYWVLVAVPARAKPKEPEVDDREESSKYPSNSKIPTGKVRVPLVGELNAFCAAVWEVNV